MNKRQKYTLASVAILSGSLLFVGCETVGDLGSVGAEIAAASGVITTNQAKSIARSSKAVGKTFADITLEQEYYIGRAVAASVLGKYKVLNNARLTEYVNLVGQSIALASDRPQTFGGYHFLVLDSDEINAFACPGGLIFVSRGMLALCNIEDELAAVLAHEVGHVQLQHGLKAIKSSRLTSALTILAAESAKQFGGEDLAALTEVFEGSISDVTSTMMNSGYARSLEISADKVAVKILNRIGYSSTALADVLAAMKGRLKPGGHDFSRTHPDPQIRINQIRRMGVREGADPDNANREQRFDSVMQTLQT